MGIFAGIENVEVRKNTKYVTPGKYKCTVEAIRQGLTNEENKPYFVAELKVVESNNIEDFPVGSTMAWMTMVKKFKSYFLKDVKNFVATATGSDMDEVTEEVVELVSGEEQPLTGILLEVIAYEGENKTSGKRFTETDFRLCVDA